MTKLQAAVPPALFVLHPPPWRIDGEQVLDLSGECITGFDQDQDIGFWTLLVMLVNAHAELYAAAERIVTHGLDLYPNDEMRVGIVYKHYEALRAAVVSASGV